MEAEAMPCRIQADSRPEVQPLEGEVSLEEVFRVRRVAVPIARQAEGVGNQVSATIVSEPFISFSVRLSIWISLLWLWYGIILP